MDQMAGNSIVTALVPLAEMQRYVSDLRSITQGRGVFAIEFSHYETVPTYLAEEIIAASQEKEEK
jgi:elongation factor G